MLPSGWIRLEYEYSLSADAEHMGVSFDYPEGKVRSMTWLGEGPYRVWRNRMKGTSFGVWNKEYNDAVTGSIQNPKQYPEFKGHHAGVRWAIYLTPSGFWQSATGRIKVDGLLKVLQPERSGTE